MFKVWERWGAALGIVGVALWAIGFAFGSQSPDTDSKDDAKITSWFTSSSHQNSQIVAFFVFLAGVLCFICFIAALRERLADAEDPRPRISQLAFGAGLISAAFWILSVVFLTGPAFLASDDASFVTADTYRVLGTMGYSSWVSATVVGAVVVWATSAVILRTRMLPRWWGWLGILIGVIQLAAVVFFPILLFWVWIAVTSVLLTWSRRSVVPPATPA
jgi:Na+/melibiose symporter-like transporter